MCLYAGTFKCSVVLTRELFLYKWALNRDRRAWQLCQFPSLLSPQDGLILTPPLPATHPVTPPSMFGVLGEEPHPKSKVFFSTVPSGQGRHFQPTFVILTRRMLLEEQSRGEGKLLPWEPTLWQMVC